MLIYDDEYETEENKNGTKDKIELQHLYLLSFGTCQIIQRNSILITCKTCVTGKCFEFFVFTQNKNSDFCAPLTSFDWNEVDPNLLGTSSIDTTCTIWGLEVT